MTAGTEVDDLARDRRRLRRLLLALVLVNLAVTPLNSTALTPALVLVPPALGCWWLHRASRYVLTLVLIWLVREAIGISTPGVGAAAGTVAAVQFATGIGGAFLLNDARNRRLFKDHGKTSSEFGVLLRDRMIVALYLPVRRRRARRGRCPTCGYPLPDGLRRGCPECGWLREDAPDS